MSRYRYNSGGVILDLKRNMSYHAGDIVDLLEEKDQRIKELEETLEKARQREVIIHQNHRQGYTKDLQEINELQEENQQLKQSLEYTNKQLDYFTNRFRGREFKRTGDCMKDIELYMKQLAIKKLEETKNYFDDSSDDKYNESEGWIITNRNVVDYVNKQIEELMKYREMKNE